MSTHRQKMSKAVVFELSNRAIEACTLVRQAAQKMGQLYMRLDEQAPSGFTHFLDRPMRQIADCESAISALGRSLALLGDEALDKSTPTSPLKATIKREKSPEVGSINHPTTLK